MKTILNTALCAASVALSALPAIAEQDANPAKFVGTYYNDGEVLTFAGSFGTFTCEQFQQFVPGIVCEGRGALQIASDGTAKVLIDINGILSEPLLSWTATGPRTIEIKSLTILYNEMSEATQWSVAINTFEFDKGFDRYENTGLVKRYPITDDPSNPTSAPVTVITTGSTGYRFD